MTDIPKREFWRKAVHGSGLFFLPILLWNREIFVGLLVVFLAFYLAVEFLARRGRRIPLLSTLTENSKRDAEKGRLSKGALYLVTSGIVLPYLFGPQAAAVGLAQIFTADVTSTWAGMKWGKKKLPYAPGKSWVGSLTYWCTGFLAALPFTSPIHAALLASLGTIVESLPIPEVDNLTVPFTVSLAFFLLA